MGRIEERPLLPVLLKNLASGGAPHAQPPYPHETKAEQAYEPQGGRPDKHHRPQGLAGAYVQRVKQKQHSSFDPPNTTRQYRERPDHCRYTVDRKGSQDREFQPEPIKDEVEGQCLTRPCSRCKSEAYGEKLGAQQPAAGLEKLQGLIGKAPMRGNRPSHKNTAR